MRRQIVASLTLLTSVLPCQFANAALIPIVGGQAVYDDTQNISWVTDANLPQTSGYPTSHSGTMLYREALEWIASLNTSNYLGVNTWRLPTTLYPDPTCSESPEQPLNLLGCRGSEMGHLFYVDGISFAHPGPFSLGTYDFGSSGIWWSSTEHPISSDARWSFDFSYGGQGPYAGNPFGGGNDARAWAVASGNVDQRSVPEPGTLLLLASALFAAGALRRRR